jgi:hypothetical protein
MSKTKNFLLIFSIGVILLLLEFCVLKVDGNIGVMITYVGIISVLGGMIGACATSKRVKELFFNLLDLIGFLP